MKLPPGPIIPDGCGSGRVCFAAGQPAEAKAMSINSGKREGNQPRVGKPDTR
jgi:hypothetical protein